MQSTLLSSMLLHSLLLPLTLPLPLTLLLTRTLLRLPPLLLLLLLKPADKGWQNLLVLAGSSSFSLRPATVTATQSPNTARSVL